MRLSGAERENRRPALFGSIHGTVNYLMVGDRIWLVRFSLARSLSKNFDASLYKDLEDLRKARDAEDVHIEAFAADINEEFLGTIRYMINEVRTYRIRRLVHCAVQTTRLTIAAESTTSSHRRSWLQCLTSTASSDRVTAVV